jgi:hypothetical protein
MRQQADALNAELLLAVDGREDRLDDAIKLAHTVMLVRTSGYVESVLERVLKAAKAPWILRLDDDESMSEAMFGWLSSRKYLHQNTDVWSFPTCALWGDDGHFITNKPLWPDPHVRLVTWQRTDWRNEPHAGSIVGLGRPAPVAILHHKYLLKSYQERIALAAKYDGLVAGGGTGAHLPFTLPEHFYDTVNVESVDTGLFPDPKLVAGLGEEVHIGVDESEIGDPHAEMRERKQNKGKYGMKEDGRSVKYLQRIVGQKSEK